MRRPSFLRRAVRAARAIASAWSEPVAAPVAAIAPAEIVTTPVKLTSSMTVRESVLQHVEPGRTKAFRPASPAPGVIAGVRGGAEMAMDDATSSALMWAQNDALDEGQAFMGYPYLAQLTQRPEYRKPAEILAKEMTRRWIKLQATGDQDKSAKLKTIEAEFERLKVQDVFRQAAEQDGFFGRSQIYIDLGTPDNAEGDAELRLPLSVSKRKIAISGLKRLGVIEPIWTYPDTYNSNNPLRPDFYKPQSWHVFGKRIHASRLLTFVSRDVPDILKPAYSFGGLSLSQMAKPYVDNWLRTRQSVSDAIHNFSVSVLQTDMTSILTGGGSTSQLVRAQFFNQTRDNNGLMMIDKEAEDFKNVSMPLGGLDHLQAQSQEHMSAVTGIPLIVLLGITPTGLNASSEGELQTFYAWVEAQQATLFTEPLKKILQIVQLSLWGEIDPEITFAFEPLQVLSDKERSEVEKTKADTDAVLITAGVISPHEARVRVAGDEDSSYDSLDLTVDPVPPPQPGMEGGDPNDPNGDGGPDDDSDPSGSGGGPGGQDPSVPPVKAPADSAPTHAAPVPAPAESPKPPAMDADPVRAAGIIFRAPDGSVLLLKRGAGGDHAGEWCFPAGKIEAGESAKEAARREAREEIGDHPESSLVAVDESADDDVAFQTFMQKVARPFVPTLNFEHTAWAWARPDSLPEPMHPGPLATLLWGDPLALDGVEFKEGDHPRANNGQFGSGGGGAPDAPVTVKKAEAPALVHHFMRESGHTEAGMRKNVQTKPTENLKKGIDLIERSGHQGAATILVKRIIQAELQRRAAFAQDAWSENDHKRAGNGQFGSGGGAPNSPIPPLTVEAPASQVTTRASEARSFIPAKLFEEAQRTIALYAKEESPTAPLTDDEKAKATEQLAGHLAAAHAAKPAYDAALTKLGDALGARVMLAPIKGGDRLLEKHVRENGSKPEEMKDLVRGSLVVKTLADVPKALEAIGATFDVARLKDRFEKPLPTGYSDILINVNLPGGIMGEVQVHVPEMLATKGELGHALYNIERKLAPGALKDQLVELQTRVYGSARDAANKRIK